MDGQVCHGFNRDQFLRALCSSRFDKKRCPTDAESARNEEMKLHDVKGLSICCVVLGRERFFESQN